MPHNTNRILVEVNETSFGVILSQGEYPFGELRVPLSPNRLARGLSDIALLLAATGGEMTPGLRTHLKEHFGASQAPSPKCEFCKLQGRILAAEGRRRLNEREDRARSIPPIEVIRPGLSGEGLARALRASETREAERLRKLPRLQGARAGKDSDAWF